MSQRSKVQIHQGNGQMREDRWPTIWNENEMKWKLKIPFVPSSIFLKPQKIRCSFRMINWCIIVPGKCKEERKVLRCKSRRLQSSSGVEKVIKTLCSLRTPRKIQGLRIQLIKQDRISKPCIYRKSYRLVKKAGKWHLEVRDGCRGKFKIRYRRKSKS